MSQGVLGLALTNPHTEVHGILEERLADAAVKALKELEDEKRKMVPGAAKSRERWQ